jgi:hypothetical protein
MQCGFAMVHPVNRSRQSGLGMARRQPLRHAKPLKENTMRHTLWGLWAAVAFATAAMPQPLYLNELLASSRTGMADEFGDQDDWVEIYNAGTTQMDAAGLYLSDDPANRAAAQIPAGHPDLTTIAAGGFLVLWLDGQPEQGPLHLDAKLSKDGEWVGLAAADGISLLDSLTFGPLGTDVSFGRLSDGGPTWGRFLQPTPGAANGGTVQTASPVFETPPGRYDAGLALELAAPQPGARIYITLDGSTPVAAESLRYQAPVPLERTTVVRALSQAPGQTISPVATGTYLVGEHYQLPVVSLATDPANLFSEASGLFVKGPGVKPGDPWPYWGANWYTQGPKPANLEFYEEGQIAAVNLGVGIEVAGSWSRALPKKSLDVRMTRDFGATALNYPLFPDNAYDVYDGLVLRAGAEDHSRAMNEAIYMAHRDFGARVDMQAYRPVVLLINGAYWGIYNLMERKDADFVERRHGVSEIDLLADYSEVVTGSRDAYDGLLKLMNDEDIAADSVYAKVRAQVSIGSLIDSWVLHVYTNHGDPNNSRYWRPLTPDGQWHWIAYDFDWWMAPDANQLAAFAAYQTAGGYQVLGRMLANAQFRAEFVNRLADFLNTSGSAARMDQFIDQAAAGVAGEIDANMARWRDWEDLGRPQTLDRGTYDWKLGWVRDFVHRRPELLRAQVMTTLGLPGTATLTVERQGPGEVEVSTLRPHAWPFAGTYFQGVPVPLTAIPEPGYRFAGWIEATGIGAQHSVLLSGDTRLTASFVPLEGSVIIDEIFYNPGLAADPGDWLELCNVSQTAVDLSGWQLLDGGESVLQLPAGTLLQPGSYLVLAGRDEQFRLAFPQVSPIVGQVTFQLANGGQTLALADAGGDLVDEVAYDDEAPWPTGPDGGGASLALANLHTDNATPANWYAAANGGTPGRPNSVQTAVVGGPPGLGTPGAFSLAAGRPNPFNGSTVISYQLPAADLVVLRLYNMAGQVVRELVRERQAAGRHDVILESGGLGSGVYVYRLESGGQEATGRVMLIK